MRKNIIIAALSLALGVCIYFLFLSDQDAPNSVLFGTPTDDSTATACIKNYRNTWTGSIYRKTRVVFYDPGTVRRYMNVTFKNLIDSMPPLKPNCKWMVGFYFMRKKNEKNVPRTSFYVIPVSYDTIKKEIDDFVDSSQVYTKTIKAGTATKRTAYDAGEMRP